ncbi:universal stress protein [Candidatus Nitrososphaera evergladensis]|nr:universal stress protein [Candidatus Nitrososphaera evergladensis]
MTGSEVSVKKILVPVDGSPVSNKAAQYAMHLAKMEGAKLVIMHVVENVKQGGAIGLQARYGNVRLVEGFQRARIKSAEEWMSKIMDNAAGQGISAKTEILSDDGTHEVGVITEYAKKNGADLIVMGSRGQSTFKKLLVGSVTNAVINHSPCPVLVVR